MKFISWNVNGFRACLNKDFDDFFREVDADAFCIQETKLQPGQIDYAPDGYHCYWHSALKKGYSGTAVFTRAEPLAVYYGMEGVHTEEGRVLTLEYADYYLVCCYTPNAQPELKRIAYRMEFEDALRNYLSTLKAQKPVVLCGDLNVAHEEIDLKHPKPNRGNPGFSDEERGKFTELLNAGFIDTFRYLYPKTVAYSWWSFRSNARQNNVGWRIDYFVVSDDARGRIQGASIYDQIFGSDHCPVALEIDL